MSFFNSLEKYIIPPFIRKWFVGRHGLTKIATNSGWLMLDTGVQIIINLFVGVWLARYLGPDLRGVMNYAQSFLAIFVPISALGLGEIMVREIVRTPDAKYELMGTAFTLQTISYLIFLPIMIGFVMVLRKGDTLVQLAVIILAIGSIFQTNRIFNWWFSSQLQSKYVVWAARSVEFGLAAAKVVLILLNASILAFIGVISLSYFFHFAARFYFYHLTGEKIRKWRFDFSRAKSLIRDGWPLAFAFIAVTIYTEIDNLMVGQILDDRAVGIYGEATRVAKLWYFIPIAITVSAYPALVRVYENHSANLFRHRIQQFLDALGIIGYISAIPAALFAPFIFIKLYGPDYIESGLVMRVYCWTFIFIALRYGMDRWLMIINQTKISIWSISIGLFTNIILNIILIPKYGIYGAAFGTLISNAVSIYLSCLIFPTLRPLFRPLLLALIVPVRPFSLLPPK